MNKAYSSSFMPVMTSSIAWASVASGLSSPAGSSSASEIATYLI